MYLSYVRGIRELHRLVLAGQDESPEADAVRDAMDIPWEALSDAERKRASSLSADLYSISEPVTGGRKEIDDKAQATLNEAFEAREKGEWDRALELMRRCADSFAPDLVSFFRGKTWLDAGDKQTALLFLEHAAQLQPDNGSYLAIWLYVLEMVNPILARERARQILRNPDKVAPIGVIRAANISFEASKSLPSVEAAHEHRLLISVLEGALTRIEEGDEARMDRWHYGIAVLLLGFCHDLLGNTQRAIHSLSKGLQKDPYSPEFLGTRGLLLYGSSPRAIGDLELAIRYGASEVWPYYFLAHHYLLNGRFEDCRVMCDRAINKLASPAIRSELAEWAAISQAELGFPADIVRSSFEEAIRLNPANDRARRNLATYESAARLPRPNRWEKRSESAVRSSAQTERYSLAA